MPSLMPPGSIRRRSCRHGVGRWPRAPRGCATAVDGGIRVERARGTAAVTRYVLKAGNGEALSDAVLPEVLCWMHGRRLMQTFGHLHGKVVADPADETPTQPRSPKRRPLGEGRGQLADGRIGAAARPSSGGWGRSHERTGPGGDRRAPHWGTRLCRHHVDASTRRRRDPESERDPAVQEALAGAAALRQPDQPLRVVPRRGRPRPGGHRQLPAMVGAPEHGQRDRAGEARSMSTSCRAMARPCQPRPTPSPARSHRPRRPAAPPPRPGGATVTPLPLSAITVDPGLQTRASMNPETVAEYAEALTAGIRLPPVVVYRDDDGALLLADGFHRVAGRRARRAQRD
jgi:hypothetical protein